MPHADPFNSIFYEKKSLMYKTQVFKEKQDYEDQEGRSTSTLEGAHAMSNPK